MNYVLVTKESLDNLKEAILRSHGGSSSIVDLNGKIVRGPTVEEAFQSVLKSVDEGDKPTRHEQDRRWLFNLGEQFYSKHWFGTMVVEFKRGLIDLVRIEETLKPPYEQKNH